MARPPSKKKRARRQLPLAAGPSTREPVPCLRCALCCSYVAVPIEAPNSVDAATEILWHLYHDYVSIYRDSDDEWLVQFETRCRHLASDNRCRIYDKRPPICRTYSEETCEVNADDEGMNFYSPESFLAYLATRSRRVYREIEKRYLPSTAELAPRPVSSRAPPRFAERFSALRHQR